MLVQCMRSSGKVGHLLPQRVLSRDDTIVFRFATLRSGRHEILQRHDLLLSGDSKTQRITESSPTCSPGPARHRVNSFTASISRPILTRYQRHSTQQFKRVIPCKRRCWSRYRSHASLQCHVHSLQRRVKSSGRRQEFRSDPRYRDWVR